MLTPPASYRIVGLRQIVLCEPGGGPGIVSVPRELVDKDRPARAEKVGERPDHSVKVSMVQRHDGGNCVKLTQQSRVLNTHRDQARVRRCGRIHSEHVEAKPGQAVNQAAVATSDIEDARTHRDRRREDSVEVLPPPRISHTPETYPSRRPRMRPPGRRSSVLVVLDAAVRACRRLAVAA